MNKIKVGILTFHRAMNYGAVLQAFALKESFLKHGAHAMIIDYRNSTIEKMYKKTFFGKVSFKTIIKTFLTLLPSKRKKSKFQAFRDDYLSLTDSSFSAATIKDANEIFDKIICGSDQVWNPDGSGFDKTYFLDFVLDKNKKYSYAASFGVSCLKEQYKESIKELLSDYPVCSVREKTGVQLLNELSILNSRVDIDPVFLLSDESWVSRFKLKKIESKPYLLVYVFEVTSEIIATVQYYKKRGLDIYYIGSLFSNPFGVKVKTFPCAGPKDFVSLFFNASSVVTNSFHGFSFSIIFNKNVLIDLLTGTSKEVNSRLINLLETFELQHKRIDPSSDICSVANASIDWASINKKIGELRANSTSYILNTILKQEK